MQAETARPKPRDVSWEMIEPWAAPLIILIFVALFYAFPVASPDASIHWDAASVQAPLQRYFASRVLTGQLPFWTPYLLSGYPFLANPEVGAWYLPNWPFFLMRDARAIQLELALNALIACLGAYLLFRKTIGRSPGAILGALAYGLSGFFAAHSSHLTVFQAAAWFPWLLWAYRRSRDNRALPGIAAGAFAGGCMILAGNLPAALFGFIGLAWYIVTDLLSAHGRRLRAVAIGLGIVTLSIAAACIQLLPSLELIQRSVLPPASSPETLKLRTLLTLILPDASQTISMKDTGMVTDHYLYAGLLLLPLALIGARNWRILAAALALIVPAAWYAFGPSAFLYRLGAVVPWMQSLGSPGIAWFVCALGLAWLAASGHHRLFRTRPRLGILLLLVFFGDLWYWNLYRNPLAFARQSYERLYNEEVGRNVAARQLNLSRFDSLAPLTGAGPLLYPLDVKFETTTGYVSLQPAIYTDYLAAMAANPRLRDGLNVQRFLNTSTGIIEPNESVLPRAYFPRRVVGVTGERQSRNALFSLNPVEQSTALVPDFALQQDSAAEAYVLRNDEQSYLIHYQSRMPSLLKLSVAWYPGWQASLNGRDLPVIRVDHALMGVVVPPGDGLVEFRFLSMYFPAGVTVTCIALVAMCGLAFGQALWKRLAMRFV
jgi:hypothetical protein